MFGKFLTLQFFDTYLKSESVGISVFGVCNTSQNATGINVCPEIERRGGWDVAQVGGGRGGH